ncbi:glycosyl transferase, partial [Metarhizium majus ARSEF 297]
MGHIGTASFCHPASNTQVGHTCARKACHIYGFIDAQNAQGIMAAVFTAHWHKSSLPLSPTNWIFYAVSKIHGHYYPLSVWCEENPSKLHAGRQDDSWHGRGLISSCLRTVSIFSNPNNRRAIQNELSMAKSFYRNPEHLLQPTFQLPNPSKSHPTSTQDDHVSLQESRDDSEYCPFPFISTCLLLGASSYLPSYRYNFFAQWQAMPLNITDQTRVAYGPVAFAAYDMLWLDHDPELDWDAWGPDFGPQKMELEDDRQRVALSGSDYITKFGYEKAENMERFYMTCPELKLLEKVPVIDACVFNGTRSTFSFLYICNYNKLIWQ